MDQKTIEIFERILGILEKDMQINYLMSKRIDLLNLKVDQLEEQIKKLRESLNKAQSDASYAKMMTTPIG